MTAIFQITNESETDSYDLLSSYVSLARSGWFTPTPTVSAKYTHSMFGVVADIQHYNQVIESVQLQGQGSQAHLASALGALDRFQETARAWHSDPLQKESVWLKVQSEGETEPRRSLIYGLTVRQQDKSAVGSTSLLDKEFVSARLGITRHPLWESASPFTISASGLSTLGGTWSIPSTLFHYGTAPGRVSDLSIRHVESLGLARVWMGIRPGVALVPTFDPLWELEDGTPGTDAAVADDANASPYASSSSNMIQASFATTTTNAKRASINVYDVIASGPEDMVGHYIVLCRTKVASGMTVAMQVRSGYAGADDSSFIQAEQVYVDNTSWQLIELGEVQVPPAGWRAASYNEYTVGYTQLQIWAELIEGSGNLDLDCLVFIPSTYYTKIDNAAVWTDPSGPSYYDAHVYTHENDLIEAQGNVNSYPSYAQANLDLQSRDWYYPTQGGVLVVAGEEDTVHTLNDDVTLGMTIYRRWLGYPY